MSTMQAVEVIISKLRDRKGFDSAFDLDDDILAEIKQEMADIIEAYAADLREREAAKEGVTDDVVQAALDACMEFPRTEFNEGTETVEAMRAALEAVWPVRAQQGEPKAWMNPDTYDVVNASRKTAWLENYGVGGNKKATGYSIPLYTHAERPVVPDGLLDHLREAARRIKDDRAPRRIPAEPGDVDLALAEVITWLEGKPEPFWVKPPAAATHPPKEPSHE